MANRPHTSEKYAQQPKRRALNVQNKDITLQCEKAKFFVYLKKKKQLIEEVETTNSDDC